MATFSELIKDFADGYLVPNLEGSVEESNAGYRVEGHELHEILDRTSRVVAAWQDPGTTDVMIWISVSWRGFARQKLEDHLRRIPLVILTVTPTEQYDDLGADVIWWSFPVECMSCGIELTDEQRRGGLCDDCLELRGGAHGWSPDTSSGGLEQRRGLHGEPLPRNRPSNG